MLVEAKAPLNAIGDALKLRTLFSVEVEISSELACGLDTQSGFLFFIVREVQIIQVLDNFCCIRGLVGPARSSLCAALVFFEFNVNRVFLRLGLALLTSLDDFVEVVPVDVLLVRQRLNDTRSELARPVLKNICE